MIVGAMSPFSNTCESTYPGIGSHTSCPHCGGMAYRVPRRWIDRLSSHWSPVLRYECQTTHCRRVFNLAGSVSTSLR